MPGHAPGRPGVAGLRRQQEFRGRRAPNAGVVDSFLAGDCDATDVLKVTTSCINKGGRDTSAAHACLRELKRAVDPSTGKPVRADVPIFNALISAHGKAADAQGARDWFYGMKASGLKPNVVSYNAVISAHEKAADPKGAREWFQHMKAAGIEPDVVSYSAVISAHAKAGDAKGAREWFDCMKDAGIEPDVMSYNAVISAHEKAPDAEGACKWFDRMKDAGIKPTVVSCSAVISALEKAGQGPEAEARLGEAVKLGVLRQSLGYDNRQNKLDFHQRAVVVGDEHAAMGISSDVARVIFRVLFNRNVLNRKTCFVVGSHGGDMLKRAIRDCMVEVGWDPRYPRDAKGRVNEGCWVAGAA